MAKLTGLLQEAAAGWVEDKATRLSAALAYYSAFSLAPLLLIAISIAGLVFGEEAAQGVVQEQLSSAIGRQGASALESMIAEAQKSGSSGVMTLVGVVLLLFSASGVFGQLKDALNTVWELETKPGRGVVGIIKDRFLSMTMVVGVGFLLLVSLILSAAISGLTDYLTTIIPLPEIVWQSANFLIGFLVATLLFAMIFKVLPDANVRWSQVWYGALLTALLFSVGRFLLGLYLGREETASAYGTAGALILVLLWVYYSSLILLYGAEFTQAYARSTGHRIVPDPDAVSVEQITREREGMVNREDLKRITERENGDQQSNRS